MNKSKLNKIIFAVLMLFAISAFAGNFATADMKSGADTEVININEASVKELSGLSGIGRSKAEAIIAFRVEHGNFENIDDIKKVKGIGSKIFDSIQDKITVR